MIYIEDIQLLTFIFICLGSSTTAKICAQVKRKDEADLFRDPTEAGGKTQLPFYLMVELLHREARLTSIQIRLVSEGTLKRIQRRKYRQLQTKIFNLWDDFNNNQKSTRQLLKAVSRMNGPRAAR
jgi:hypothetical protein